MKVVTRIDELRMSLCTQRQRDPITIGFVPTMGFLHEGHLSLILQAKEQCDVVVVSIFVNPLQFGPNEDFDQYPRDFHRDEKLAAETGADVLFYPSTDEMYQNESGISLSVTKKTDVLCGEKRPGHFDGVVTVLTKLFNIVQPDRAYFGQKDAQQIAIVDDLIHTFFIPIQLVICPTVRELDGLAKSSRNVNLKEKERKVAPQLYKELTKARNAALEGASVSKVREDLVKNLQNLQCGQIDYVEILSYPKLEQIDSFVGKTIIALAYQFEGARLIDNIIID